MEIVQDYERYPIISAVIDEDISKINFYLKKKANVNETNEDRNTALIVAAFLGNASICDFLIKKGALIDYSNKNGKNAMMIAYENKQYKVVQTLVSRGANIDLETVSGTPYLYDSVLQNDRRMVKIMLDAGVSTEKVNEFGDTPLQCAVRHNNVELGQLLIDYHANIHDDKYNNYSVLMNACDVGNVNVVKWFIKHDSNLEHKSIDGRTALMIAAQLGHYNVVDLLIKNGAEIESKDFYGANALMKAAQNGYYDVVELLNEKGANIDATDDEGWTALHYACLTGEVKIIRYLLEEKINKKFRVDPISVAIESFQLSAVLLLSQNGFPLTNKLPDGRTYLELAEDVNCMSVSIFLRDVNAGIFDESKIEGYLTHDENFETVESIDEELEGITPTQFSIKKTEKPENVEEDIFDFDLSFGEGEDPEEDDLSEEEIIQNEIEDQKETAARSERLKLLDELSGSFNLKTDIDGDVKLNVDSSKLSTDIKNDLEKLIRSVKDDPKRNLNKSNEKIDIADLDLDMGLDLDLESDYGGINDSSSSNIDSTKETNESKDTTVIEVTSVNKISGKTGKIFDEIEPVETITKKDFMDLEAMEKEILKIQQSNPKFNVEEANKEDNQEKIKKNSEINLDDLLENINTFADLDSDLSTFVTTEPEYDESLNDVVEEEKLDEEPLRETTIEQKDDDEIIVDLEIDLTEEIVDNIENDNTSKHDFIIDEVDIEEEFSFSINDELDFVGKDNQDNKLGKVFEEFDFTKRAPNSEALAANLFKEHTKIEQYAKKVEPKVEPICIDNMVEPKVDPISIENIVEPKVDPISIENIVETKREDLFKDYITRGQSVVDGSVKESSDEHVIPEVESEETIKLSKVEPVENVNKIREDEAEFVNFNALSYDEYITNEDSLNDEVTLNKKPELTNQQQDEKKIEEVFRLNLDLVHDGKFRPEELYNLIKDNKKYLRAQPLVEEDFVEIINKNEKLLLSEKVNEEELFDILKINIHNQAQFEVIVDKLNSERVNINKQEKLQPENKPLIEDILGKENRTPAEQTRENLDEKDDFISKTIVRVLSYDQEYGLGEGKKRPVDSIDDVKKIDGNIYETNSNSKEVDELIFANKHEEEVYKQYMEKLKPGKLYDSHDSTLVDVSDEAKTDTSDYYAEIASAVKKEQSSSFNQHSHDAVRILNDMFNDKVSKGDKTIDPENKKANVEDSYKKIIEEVKEYRETNVAKPVTSKEVEVKKEVKQVPIANSELDDEGVSQNSLELGEKEDVSDGEVTLRTLLQDFVYAVNHNDTDLILGLQNIQFFINELEHIQISPLILAISNDNMLLFDYFIEMGATINIRVEKGFTPLMVAAQYNNPYAIDVLINYGAFINDISDRDFTALMIASQRGNLDAVIILCEYGADYYINSTCGNSALILATAKNRINIVEFFVNEGFDLMVETGEGLTALDIAYAKNYYRLIQILSYAMYSNGY